MKLSFGFILVFAAMSLLIVRPALAQIPSQGLPAGLPTSPAPAITSPPLAPPIVLSTGGVKTPEAQFVVTARSPLVWLRFRRFLTRNPVKRSELTLAIGNLLLLQAREAQTRGQALRATTSLDHFAQEMTTLQVITAQLVAKSDPLTQAFLDRLLSDKTAQLGLLEEIRPEAASELARKLTNVRAKTVRDMVEVLEHPNLRPEERERKLAKIMAKYSEKEGKIDAKIAKKLALTGALDEETDDEALKAALDDEEDGLAGESARLTPGQLSQILAAINRRSDQKRLVILEKLNQRVPEAAKGGIETALNALIDQKVTEFSRSPQALEKFLDENSGSSKVRQAILERVKAKAVGEVRTRLEEGERKRQEDQKRDKSQERSDEGDREKKETTREKPQATDLDDDNDNASPKPTPTPSPKVTATAKPTATPEAREVTIEIDDDDRFKETTLRAARGSLITVRFKNKSNYSRTITLGNGLTSGSVAPDNEKTLASFVLAADTTFSSTYIGSTISGTITAE